MNKKIIVAALTISISFGSGETELLVVATKSILTSISKNPIETYPSQDKIKLSEQVQTLLSKIPSHEDQLKYSEIIDLAQCILNRLTVK